MKTLLTPYRNYLLPIEEFVAGFIVEFTLVSEVVLSEVKVDDGEIICSGFDVCDAEDDTVAAIWLKQM